MKRTMILMIALGAGLAGSAAGAEAGRYATKPTLSRPQPPSAESLVTVPGHSTAGMACTQCKSVTLVSKQWAATKPSHGYRTVTQKVHQCPGCRDAYARKIGTKEMVWTHLCTLPGEKARCCAVTTGKTRG